MEKKKINSYEPKTNIWYRESPDNLGELDIYRNVELNGPQHPGEGMEYKTAPNRENTKWDDSMTYKTGVDGILKLDKSNPIWKADDKDIKTAVIQKIKEQYGFINESNLEITINRQAGTIAYKGKEKVTALKIIADKRVKRPFNLLDADDLFYIDRQVMMAELSIDQNQQWTKLPRWDNDTVWIKRSDYQFCIFKSATEQSTQCVNAVYSFKNIKVGTIFNIDADGTKEHSIKYYNYMKGILKRDITDEEQFEKLDATHFAPYPAEQTPKLNKDGTPMVDEKNAQIMQRIKLGTNTPENIRVYFNIFVVEVDPKFVPDTSEELGVIPVGSVFVVPDAYIDPKYDKKFKPYITTFLKVNQKTFIFYKAGKKYDFSVDEEEEGETKTKTKINENDKFDIKDGLEVGYTNWDKREISPEIRVIVYSQEDIAQPKKKASLEAVLETLFTKFEVKEDNKGRYIKLPENALYGELQRYTQEFQQKTSTQDVEIPEYEADASGAPMKDEKDQPITKKDPVTGKPITRKEATKMGNTEHFSWVFDKDKQVIITDHRAKK